MTTVVIEVYDAFLDAGASDGHARRAAEAMASQSSRFDQLDAKIDRVKAELEAKIDRVKAELEAKIDRLEASLRADIASIRAELVLMRWMLGTSLALSVTILVKLFVH